jgi:tripartite-type tricarboxylate transporter receptor subunit TctC
MKSFWRRTIASILPLFVLGLSAPALAQDYPTHPVRLITDSAPGSSIDVPVRIIAEGLSRIWGQQAVVINQPGAGGAIAARTPRRQRPTVTRSASWPRPLS